MVTRYGFSKNIGVINYDDDDYEGDLDEDLDDDFEVTDLRQQIVEAEEDTDE